MTMRPAFLAIPGSAAVIGAVFQTRPDSAQTEQHPFSSFSGSDSGASASGACIAFRKVLRRNCLFNFCQSKEREK